MSGEPCGRCGEPADRANWGTAALCRGCLGTARAPIRERVIARQGDIDRWPPPGLDGIARIVGRHRPEYGPNVYDVACDQCDATWCAEPGDPCPWCLRQLELLQEMHRRALLSPDLPDLDDQRRHASMTSWAGRLARAVQAEIVTEHEARAAIQREEGRRVS